MAVSARVASTDRHAANMVNQKSQPPPNSGSRIDRNQVPLNLKKKHGGLGSLVGYPLLGVRKSKVDGACARVCGRASSGCLQHVVGMMMGGGEGGKGSQSRVDVAAQRVRTLAM